nr:MULTISPECIES: hypothetical protein [unclassified Bacillus (in: firmicutes)]
MIIWHSLMASLYIDRTAGEATAKCDQEAADFMALNLMHDMVTGRRNVKDARRFISGILWWL